MSFEQDPPAFTQPTLPPPPVAPSGPAAALPKRRIGLALGGVAIAAASALGGYVLHLSHESEAARAAAVATTTLTMAQVGDVATRFGKMLAAFPAESEESICPDDVGGPAAPVVLYSAADAAKTGSGPSAAESALFVGAVPPDAVDRLGAARRVAVLRTLDLREPVSSRGAPTGGRYEAQLAVYGPKSEQPLCQTRVLVWSSSTLLEPGMSERSLREDFTTRVLTSVAEAGARMHVDLDL